MPHEMPAKRPVNDRRYQLPTEEPLLLDEELLLDMRVRAGIEAYEAARFDPFVAEANSAWQTGEPDRVTTLVYLQNAAGDLETSIEMNFTVHFLDGTAVVAGDPEFVLPEEPEAAAPQMG